MKIRWRFYGSLKGEFQLMERQSLAAVVRVIRSNKHVIKSGSYDIRPRYLFCRASFTPDLLREVRKSQ